MALNRVLIGGASAFALSTGGFAYAQDAETTTAEEPRRLTSVTVTAQKREQSLQDVPIVVTALPTQLVEDAGVSDIKDLTILTPGLLVTSSASTTDTTARIRGVGTVGNNPGLESSVGVVIDGVPRARNGVAFGDLGEIERIEVLKGPQGTLFGKSTSAGVINVITKGAEDEFGAQLELTAGNFGLLRTSASMTGPLSDNVSGRLFGVFEQQDGLLDVVTGDGPRTNNEDVDHEFYSIRGQLDIDVSPNLSIDLTADYTDREENCCLADYVSVDPGRGPAVVAIAGGVGASAPTDPFDRVAFGNRDTDQKIEDWGLSAEVNWDLGFGDLVSLTSYRSYESGLGGDTDYSAADIWYRTSDGTINAFDTFSKELRLSGSTENVDWLVGAFFAQEDLDRIDNLFYGEDYFTYWNALFAGGFTSFDGLFWDANAPATNDAFQQEATTIALFTHNTFAVTDRLDIVAGLRFSQDEKDLSTQYNSESPSCATVAPAMSAALNSVACLPWSNDIFVDFDTEQSRTDEEFSGTLKASYDLTDNVMIYGSVDRGYKAGGFNLDRASDGATVTVDTSFEPETVEALEVGMKTNNADESLFLNGAIFYQDYSDFQLNTFTGTSFIVTSIPQVISKGVDMDFRYLPANLEALTIQGGITYAETQYGDFVAADFNAPPLLPDRTISFAPRWSGSLAATLDTDFIGDWEARWNTSLRYTSRYNTGSNLDPQKDVDELVLVNARAVFLSDDSPISLELWAQNLTDEDYFQVAFDTPLQGSAGSAIAAFLSSPRTYGATIKAKF